MRKNKGFSAFNLGNGDGFSVLDVINASIDLTARSITYEVEARRAGDPAVLVANSTMAKLKLDWKPQYPTLIEIVASAWNWHKI
jgi:UDP-glucose 4-epimerase